MSRTAELRQCFFDALPEEMQAENFSPPPRQVYLPPGHRRALSLDRPLIVGGRGAGKTFWLDALLNNEKRSLIASAFNLPELARTTVLAGFSISPKEGGFVPPNSRVFRNLFEKDFEAYDIWSAVTLAAIVGRDKLPGTSWEEIITWVAQNGERVGDLLDRAEQENRSANRTQLILFDGLDRIAPHSWEATEELVRGLLMTAQEFRGYRTLRLKVFLRPDMLEGRIIAFPDASKLVSNVVVLEWADTHLYGLLWQYLGNGSNEQSASRFRSFASEVTELAWPSVEGSYPVPELLRNDSKLQQTLFHALAGKAMGGGSNRGDTWKWLPNHLADENAYVSPRSFLMALRHATQDSIKRDVSGKEAYPLLWRAIQDGVAEASKTRVTELYEDFPWARNALEPLAGLGVPCSEKDVVAQWKSADTLKIVSQAETESGRLPPLNVRKRDPRTLLKVLVELGVFRIMADGRINMPDIFRVEAKMPRRGGVPVRRQ